MKITAFTAGAEVPSARFRVRQYIPYLARQGIEMVEMPAAAGSYPPPSRLVRPAWAIATLGLRLPQIASSYGSDAVLLQREFISTLPTLERFTKAPRLLDVDDAIHLYRHGRAAMRLAQWCDLVICGNTYLADHYTNWGAKVRILPTAVDTVRFRPRLRPQSPDRVVIGWIGTSANLRYIHGVEDAVRGVLNSNPSAQLFIVSDRRPSFKGTFNSSQLEYVPWTEAAEVDLLQRMDIGIMPLEDSEWARGKCSFKMLQYMACGIPVVVSPVGMNAEVLRHGDIGFGVSTAEDWYAALSELVGDEDARLHRGKLGRKVAEQHYSIEALAPRLAACFREVLGLRTD